MKYMLALVIVLVAATVYFVTRPDPEYRVGSTLEEVPIERAEPDPVATPAEPADGVEDERLAAMQAEFEALKKARRNLESRLNRLKVVLYGIELPAEERNAISESMKNGYRLLKNKKLLGAYSELQAITDELRQVEYVKDELQVIEDKYRAQRRPE